MQMSLTECDLEEIVLDALFEHAQEDASWLEEDDDE